MKFMKLGSKSDSFQSDGNMRYVATELAADFVVNVGDIKFYLHKFPLLSKSARLQKLLGNGNDESNDEVHIPDIPGGASAFEICAKFCYGMIVTLNAYNVIAARCAAEYLEMHEVVEKGNLIYKIEVFLNTSIFRSWKDSIIVLQTTRSLFPWSEELKVVSRCVDCIASKASVEPSKVDWSYTYNRRKLPSENGIDPHWNGVRRQMTVPKDWWVEDLCELEMDFYKRVIVAIKSKGMISGDLIGEALKAYALKWLPAFGRDQVHGSEAAKNRSLVETVIWLLPAEKDCVPCGFLLKLLKAGTLLEIGETAKRELIKKVGMQLHEASAVDLLLPAPVGENGLYDVGIVQNMVEEFLMQEQSGRTGHLAVEDELLSDERASTSVSYASKLAVAKVIDSYLLEIGRDPDLPLSKFVDLAEMVPSAARPVHDVLYHAIDMYLKEHPGISKSEKKRICMLMDCRKLSMDASMHAAQNDRLPLRVVVQVLFFEQVRSGAAGGLGSVDIPGAIRTLLPPENGGSLGSSRTATTNTEEDWDGAAVTSEDLRSIKGELAAMRFGGDKRGVGDMKNADKMSSKMRGILKSSRIFSKLLSNKEKGENSSSDTSESPGSVNPGDNKSTWKPPHLISFFLLRIKVMESLGSSIPVPNVQELAKENIYAIPDRYIHPDKQAAVVSDSEKMPSIPVIDFQSLFYGEPSEREKLHHACKEWGFFQLINHEVKTKIVDEIKEEIRRFFANPYEEKKSLSQAPREIEGYGQAFVVSNDQKLDWADMFYLVTLPSYLRKQHIWQLLSPSFRSAIENYAIETQKLAMKLLELMANNLGMKTDELHESYDDGTQAMRMNYYPPCPQPDLVIGLSPHSDAVGLTLLLQITDVQGLQIKKDGAWIPVSPLQNAFVVNIGDIMEIISNGVYPSIEHRAIVSHDAARLSIATFFSPNMNVEIGPAPSLLTPETPPLFERIGMPQLFKISFARKLQGKAHIDDIRITRRNEHSKEWMP